MAPALGLYLGELFFDGYNKKQRQQMQNDLRLAAIRAEKAAKVWPPPAPAAPVVQGECGLLSDVGILLHIIVVSEFCELHCCCVLVCLTNMIMSLLLPSHSQLEKKRRKPKEPPRRPV